MFPSSKSWIQIHFPQNQPKIKTKKNLEECRNFTIVLSKRTIIRINPS